MLFLSTPSARRATWPDRPSSPARIISIHALREEGDLFRNYERSKIIYFYPRPPRGGRLVPNRIVWEHWKISIHALREEGDRVSVVVKIFSVIFLSTPSARRATYADDGLYFNGKNFYPRPPRGGRLFRPEPTALGALISIHALREEGDVTGGLFGQPARDFYPRPPRGGRLYLFRDVSRYIVISIHALREEGDHGMCASSYVSVNFYPRPPRGGRQPGSEAFLRRFIFLSTPSARRATYVAGYVTKKVDISIHALREEGDARPVLPDLQILDFYPRPPRGGRQQKQRQNLYFQINYTTFCTNLEEL